MHRLGLCSFLSLILLASAANGKTAGSHPGGECGVAIGQLLSRSGFGSRIDGLKEELKVDSFMVADIRRSMKIADTAVASQPAELGISDELKREYDRLSGQHSAARESLSKASSEIGKIERSRDSILNLMKGTQNLRKSLDYYNQQLAEATKNFEQAKAKRDEANAKLNEFLVANSLIEKEVERWDRDGKYIGSVRLVKANSQRQALEKAIQSGEVADSNRRLLQLESDANSRASLPDFDEIVVIRRTAFSDFEKLRQENRLVLNLLQEYDANDARINSLEGHAKTELPTAVKQEIAGEISRLKKHKEAMKPKVEAALRSEEQFREMIYTWRPITILKNKGVIVAALRDGSTKVGSELDSESSGILCKGSELSRAWLGSDKGFVSREDCFNKQMTETCMSAFPREFHDRGRSTGGRSQRTEK